MAKSSADDAELRRACEAAIEGTKQKIVLSIRVAKTHGTWGKTSKLGRQMAKPRVLAISTKAKAQRTKAFLRVLKYSNGGVLEPAKIYKLKHLSKVEVVTNDPSGCTFTLGFDNLRSQSVAPPQWTMRNVDDRNRLLFSILNICKDVLDRLPKVVGIDVVEMALWAKENTPKVTTQNKQEDGHSVESTATETELKVNVEKDLVSQAEEEDMEALLGTYVMGIGEAEAFSERLKRELQALEAANVHAILESEPLIDEVLQGLEVATHCVEDVGEWLGMFNVKLRHMREDIESIEIRNNKLEMQSVNNRSLIDELDKLLERLSIPAEYSACLTGDSFDEARMLQNVEAVEWLISAMRRLEMNMDPTYAKMRGVKEKRGELQILKSTFVRKASEFLRNYFASFIDFMMNDKSYFSQRGQLKRPDHADLRFKCRTYARLLQYLKVLDKNCLGPLRKAYCCSLNLLLRREAREFSNELRTSTKAPRNATIWLEGSTGSGQNVNSADTSTVSDAYAKILTIFIPLLVDESSFFAHFMCFEVPTLVPPGGSGKKTGNEDDANDDDMEKDSKSGKNSAELAALNEALQDLLDGIQEDFYAVVDWAYKIDPLRCISMHGITERYLSGQKADAAGFVRLLLGDLESRISMQFSRYVDEACHQIERYERNVRQMGVLGYIPRFASLATRMEQYISGQSRDLVDQAYTKFVSIMFVTLEKLAQTDPKYADIFLLENYAAFQNSNLNAFSSLLEGLRT
ncbi:PREDICTED: exocyst complex component SEC3A-like isoform X5 [Lupinus angustifolius]|uniref:exocyst complex component SEC3A-like isoform X5 n=1 Tax=Lupinus angustifolius TaxID=3871 RepID=UPI00092FA53F|nr:PREDICTED: exocyst complex component SEC3A-like isoform X5 [Lupinus angustifolius]